MSRRFLAAVLLAVALPALSQQPPKLEPLPEIPPPPPGISSEQPGEPPVRIQPGGGDQVEERLIDGRRVARVTTPAGQEYYLIEDLGDGPGLRKQSLDPGAPVALWVIRPVSRGRGGRRTLRAHVCPYTPH